MFIALQEQCAKDIKEKEIEIHCWKCSVKDYKKHHEKALDDLVRITNKVEQRKISFAVEQLEKVKETLLNRYSDNIYQFSITNGTGKLTFSEEYLKIFINKEFYKQITTIKGDKEV